MTNIRFWCKVKKTDSCWEWIAGLSKSGYGNFRFDGKKMRAHRVSWFLTHGTFPDLFVCHTCDNPKCVNPDHLFLGTAQDNMSDKVDKNRQSRGVVHMTNLKLTQEDVIAIRESSDSQRSIAKRYDISRQQVGRIKNLKQWKDNK